MELVREGARVERNQFAHLVPFAIRGGFVATFMNKYSALPMALTGALSNELAAKRVFETATFFTLTVMPGALDRHGEAFKAAAMVRLMHSMVRFNVMRSPGLWDSRVYGVPIPQVDQMPAGQIGSFLMAFRALREGRNEFTPAERARIEIARYRCFLLGLPEPLLGETPRAIAISTSCSRPSGRILIATSRPSRFAPGEVHLPHPALAELLDDAIRGERPADHRHLPRQADLETLGGG